MECKHRVKRHDKKSDSAKRENQVDKVLELVKKDKILEFIKRSDKEDKKQKDEAKDKSSMKEVDDSLKVIMKFFIQLLLNFFEAK